VSGKHELGVWFKSKFKLRRTRLFFREPFEAERKKLIERETGYGYQRFDQLLVGVRSES